jgi:hypothetical protein
MNRQISLIDAGMCERPGQEKVEGEALDFVLDGIPRVGHRKGTWRETRNRPLATLYSRSQSGGYETEAGTLAETVDQWWPRPHATETGPAWQTSAVERSVRGVPKSHGDAKFWLDYLHGMHETVRDFAARIEPGLRACGVKLMRRSDGRAAGALLSSLHPLVIAMCWDDATAAGCFLASAVEPLSFEWRVRVDDALDRGLPWAQRLAELSALHGPLDRAWRWVYENRIQGSWWARTCTRCQGDGVDPHAFKPSGARVLALGMAMLSGCSAQARVNALRGTLVTLTATCESADVAGDIASEFDGSDADTAESIAALVGVTSCFAKGFVARQLERAEARLSRELSAPEAARQEELYDAEVELLDALAQCESTPGPEQASRLRAARAQCTKLEAVTS